MVETVLPSHTVSVGDLMTELAAVLAAARIDNPTAEARDIVGAVLGVERLWPSVHRRVCVSRSHAARARMAARKRSLGAPFAYAVGRAAFRYLTLDVDERVLIPRQETEMLVTAVLEQDLAPGGLAIDIGTGSGAIALSLAIEGRFARIIGTDVSLGALEVARRNAALLPTAMRPQAGTRRLPIMEFRHGSLLAPVQGERAQVVVVNPPYIAAREATMLPASVRDWEPPVALFSGADGMTMTALIIAGAAAILEPGGLLALELDSRRAFQAATLALADGSFCNVSVGLDLTGRERILLATLVE